MSDVKPITQNQDQQKEQRRLKAERARWEACMDVARRDGMALDKAVAYYNIDKKVVTAEEMTQILPDERKGRRKDKYQAADKFINENVGTVITPAELAEVSGFSYPTAIKYINSHPHHFRKEGRGKYEIRDPKSDRENEKTESDNQE